MPSPAIAPMSMALSSIVSSILLAWINAVPCSGVASSIPHWTRDDSDVRLQGVAITANELESWTHGVQLVEDKRCQEEWNQTKVALVEGQSWAVAMYDSLAKAAAGVQSGVLYNFGHYDECLGSNDDSAIYHGINTTMQTVNAVRPKYCLANVTMEGLTVQNIASRRIQLADETVVRWGACVPATCNARDLTTFLTRFLQRNVTVDDRSCETRSTTAGGDIRITGAMFYYVFVIMCFLLLTALSTFYHAYSLWARRKEAATKVNDNRRCNNEILRMSLISFSIIENSKKIFQAGRAQDGLNPINGVKAISMCMILIGHALAFILSGPVYNAEFLNRYIKMPAFASITNSFLFVDIFLLLSGFLFCRILLVELERRHGRVNLVLLYAARYIRLTPAYLVVIGFYMTWLPSIGDGPLWQQRIQREHDRCHASWWLNILYINNYANTDKLCMFQSWYLSVDSQLFFVSAVVIFVLYKWRHLGLYLLWLLVVGTAIVPFAATFIWRLDPTLLVYADEFNDLGSNNYFTGVYIKTHMRASSYAAGLLAGYLVHVMQMRRTKLPTLLLRVVWIVMVVAGTLSMHCVSRFYARPYTNLESTMYAGFHKIGWNVSISWLVIALTTGHGGWLQRLLSHPVFSPLSRLSYCAFLCNGLVELYHSSHVRTSNYINIVGLANEAIGHCLNTYALALVVCLVFESPVHALERILLRKRGNTGRTGSSQQNCDEDRSRTDSTSLNQAA